MSAFQFPKFDGNALCAETDPEAFFPELGGSARAAKKVCAACDIREACLNFALANDEHHGVWGGKSERERRRLRRDSQRPPSRVELRRQTVAEYLDKDWSPTAVAQLLGVPLHIVQHDRLALREAS